MKDIKKNLQFNKYLIRRLHGYSLFSKMFFAIKSYICFAVNVIQSEKKKLS